METLKSYGIQGVFMLDYVQDIYYEGMDTRATWDKSSTGLRGSIAVDGKVVTNHQLLTYHSRSHTAFDDQVCGARLDHRCLWIDIKSSTLFGAVPRKLFVFKDKN